MSGQMQETDLSPIIKKWKNKQGNLIMILHSIQDKKGFVPRESALELSAELGVPLAQIYEVLTFYNYFKLTSPGKAVISVCTGTACYLKGANDLVEEVSNELGIFPGESTEDGIFHLQCVRCVGCCGLAPVITINGKTYGKVKPSEIKSILSDWREKFLQGGPHD